ncbi:hypothetical protein TSEDIMI_70124 [Tenacibaculum sediminilitoris]|uniref:hypothetical protein n=1 Tax=Tenacibaculum sediminilitoris TaxID=1820334 RepID=UPI003894888D
MNLVFESDSHIVKTTWPVKPCSTGSNCDEGFVRDDVNGTVYVGEGYWGAPLRLSNDSKNWTRDASTFNQFKWIFVEESKIEIRTIKVDNTSSVGAVSNQNPFTQFTTDETNSVSTSFKIQDSSNAPNITSQSYNITSRSYNSQSVAWNPSSWSSVGAFETAQRTPGLKPLVQYVVNKSNWATGNSMLFYISGTGERTAESYNGSSAIVLKLMVTYSTESPDNGGGETPEYEGVNVTITFDKYSYETSWTLKDGNGLTVMSGGDYTQGNEELKSEPI